MIRINYECDETNQKMEIKIHIKDEDNGTDNVEVKFDPEVKEDIEDPYGIALKIFNICTGRE